MILSFFQKLKFLGSYNNFSDSTPGLLHQFGSFTPMQDLSDITIGLLNPFQEFPTHINYFSFHNLKLQVFIGSSPKDKLNPYSPRMVNNHTVHPHPNRRDVAVHMNAMMSIHISNSNGSYAIIFHIIQTFMLTHQLACINTSFSIHISSHSIKTITVLFSTHHSCF